MAAERDITSVPSEMISYDKVDPLPTENPFYFNEDSKINKFVNEKESKFPVIHMSIFCIIIPIMSFLMGIFYIGGLWDPVKKINDLKYVIVNEDQGCSADPNIPFCANPYIKLGSVYSQLTYQYLSNQGAGQFEIATEGNTYDYAMEQIDKHKYWMALHIPKTFTTDILSNLVASGAKQISPQSAYINMMYDEARSFTTVNFVNKAFNKLPPVFHRALVNSTSFAGILSKFQVNITDLNNLRQLPFNTPFHYSGITYNKVSPYPISVYGQYFCTFVSFILLWIGTIATALITHFVFPLESHWVEKKDNQHAIIKTMAAKTLTCVLLLIAICLITAIIPLCCGTVTMKKGFGSVFFFFFFFSLSGIGVNNLFVHLFHFINFYLVAVTFMFLQFITCGGVVHNDIQYSFFKIGRAFPMFYGVREIKYIYFGSGKHTQATNVLIILGWAIVFLIASYYLYYLELKVKREKYLRRNSKSQPSN